MDFLGIKATEIGTSLLRPLPTIFAYAKGAKKQQLVPAVLEEEFFAHVDCLIDLLETACLRIGAPSSVCKEVSQKAVNLTRVDKKDLPEGVNDLLFHLRRLSDIHGAALKKELNQHPDVYRDIYWGRVYTKKLTLVHQGEREESIAKLETSLGDRCSYDVTLAQEKDLVLKPMSSDFVLFRPCQGPIRPATLSGVTNLGVPILILIDLGKKVETADPVMVRTAHQYSKSGIPVLHRPFTPLRLFTAIDTCYVSHLFERPAFAGARSKGAVA